MTDTSQIDSSRALLATAGALKGKTITIEQLRTRIELDLKEHPHLSGIRDYNRLNLDAVTHQLPSGHKGGRILDVGASIHGFALDAADQLGFDEYIGIDLDVHRQWGANLLQADSGGRSHYLCQMDAHRLWIEDDSVDVVVCLSGFEHYLFPEMVLREILRVLRKGGFGLINYEPIWTCSYGHHLHHFGLGFDQVPPWSHLILDRLRMAELLDGKDWPAACPISREAAVEWIYSGREINRRDCRFHASLFKNVLCSRTLWCLPNKDPSAAAEEAVDYAASMLPFSRDELMTRGFSYCFQK